MLRSFFGELDRFLNGVVSELFALGVDVEVVVGSDGEGDAPARHGGSGIELGGLLEGADGFFVIETVEERESLIEIILCRFAGGVNGVMLAADGGHGEVGSFRGGRLWRCVMVLSERRGTQQRG